MKRCWNPLLTLNKVNHHFSYDAPRMKFRGFFAALSDFYGNGFADGQKGKPPRISPSAVLFLFLLFNF